MRELLDQADLCVSRSSAVFRSSGKRCEVSVLSVNGLCRDIERDSMLRRSFIIDCRGALYGYPREFTFAEREALLTADVVKLLQLGVNSKLIGNLCRHKIFGMTMEAYAAGLASCEPFMIVSLLV
jgi:hypothetical protein